MNTMFYSSAPARVCLYGEHQDYLKQKVIPAAVNLRLYIRSKKTSKSKINIKSRDLNNEVTLPNNLTRLTSDIGSFESYLEAGMLAFKNFKHETSIAPIDVTIVSQIPIASGLSSSAALLVAWIENLAGVADVHLNEREVAEIAYDAEHNILGIPCGKMDQYASSFGKIICLSTTEPPEVKQLNEPQVDLIVVDSKTPKFTSDVHGDKVQKIKTAVTKFENLTKSNLSELSVDSLNQRKNDLSVKDLKILKAVISIKENTLEAEHELSKQNMDYELLGDLLTKQQIQLREGIGVSLPILDKIVDESIALGALGGKLTGAGLGGSVVIMSIDNTQEIANSLRQKLKLPVKTVKIDEGSSLVVK